ncbi:heat shock cognate 70 kDa protein-like protein [Tanacetum coccineum]
MLEEFFDGKRLYRSLNGDEAVALGATILVARLSEKDDNTKKDVVLHDVTPRSLRTLVKINYERGHMRVIIPKNIGIPTSKKRIFDSHVNVTSLQILMYKGEGVKVNDNMRLGNLFSGLTLGTNERSTIEVCFNLDSNGILLVIAEEISTGDRLSRFASIWIVMGSFSLLQKKYP